MDNGFITLNRRLLHWEWYDDAEMVRFWTFLLFKANWQQKQWHGILIPRGSFVSSLAHLSRDSHRSQRAIRTMCQRLKSTGELTSKSTNKYTIYTIVKYEEYQSEEIRLTNKTTSKPSNERHSNDIQTTTTEQYKQRNKENNKHTMGFSSHEYDRFWLEFPKKRDKAGCLRIWMRKNLDPKIELILSALRKEKESSQWTRDAGQYIPNPSTWLNQERWEDRLETIKEKTWEDIFDEKQKAKGAL